ncbi:hypothetical protein EPUL_003722 [Erysiphe pulchra]|uniref:Major facilitator superfamily (MFS) profile domain-containing protein n=1 Tax=Erysiphe pulchra TaxID=225359 RepID=A0A2S4PUX3_9PEZI|nr:hypothetical protein EPUL_003722 [Erysiphe pulchra]
MNSNASSDGSGEKPDLEVADQATSLSRGKIAIVFLTCSAVDFAALFDQNTLAVALPIISSSLGASSQLSSIAAAYFITATSFQLLYGRLSDIWSRKLILIAGIAIFFLGSLGASLAKSVTEIIAFRALTGIGGGGLVTLVQIIVGDVVSLRERGRWQGILESLIFGYMLWCIGLGLHSSLRPSTGLAVQLVYGFLLGFGAGHTFQPSLIAMQAAVSKDNMAVITGVRSFIRDLGGTFGLAIAGSIISHSLREVLSKATLYNQEILSSQQINEILKGPIDSGILEKTDTIRSLVLSGYFAGFRRVFYFSTALAIVTIVATVFFIPQVELSVEEKEELDKARNSSDDLRKSNNSISESI